MEAGGSRNVHDQVTVMRPMKSPKERYLMVNAMPEVENKVKNKKGRNKFYPPWSLERGEKTDIIF